MKKHTTHLPPDPSRTPNRRRIRSPSLSRVRLRRPVNAAGGGGGGRRGGGGGPATPLLEWKLSAADPGPHPPASFSARKLAAGMLGLEPSVYDHRSCALHTNTKKYSHAPILLNNPKNDKIQASAALPNSSMERATKWDAEFYSHWNLLEEQQVPAATDVSSLQSELEQARSRIAELENERRSAKKKLDHFLEKLAEEKELWRRREHEKVRQVIDSIKEDLRKERKNRQRMEIMNSKIVSELAEARMSAKRFLQDYERERKARELMEEVCEELAKEIGEDRAEVETLKVESMRIREEVEEEKRMLQMAEVWREERVQMKLVDAKVTLEDKYLLLSKLQAEIEAFLKAQSNSTSTNMEGKMEAELLKEAADMVMVQEVKEFSYQSPPASEDIFSVFEELQPREESNEREIEANGKADRHGNTDDDSGWETVSHVDEHGSSNSLPGSSDPSVNGGGCEESNASVSGTDWDKNGDSRKFGSEISEVFSSATRQSRKKGSSITRLWRSSCPKKGGEIYKKHLFEATIGRLSNGRLSSATTLSPDTTTRSGEAELSSPSVGQWSSPDSVNPTKGCVEWPRGVQQKHSLKSKLVEARMRSQKIQLRQALEQKI